MASESRPDRAKMLRMLAKCALVYGLLTAAFDSLGSLYCAALIPTLQTSFRLTHPALGVPSFSVHANALHLKTKLKVRVPGRARRRNMTAQFELPLRTLYVCPIIALTLLYAWPGRSNAAKFRALMLCVPLVGLVESADTAQTFALLLSEKLAGSSGGYGGLGPFWGFFLENGGRQLLSILVAPLALLGGDAVERFRPRSGVKRDCAMRTTTDSI